MVETKSLKPALTFRNVKERMNKNVLYKHLLNIKPNY